MLRVLMADDQIPDENIPNGQVVAEYRKRYPGELNEKFTAAFGTMRQAVQTMRDGFDVTIANHHRDALSLVQKEQFDVAIIDLGWAVDKASLGNKERTAGWKIVEAIQREDAKHPERPPTALMIYSARFATHADLSQQAADKGILPFYKPYGERHSVPLGADEVSAKGPSKAEQELAACKSLRAVVGFIGHLRESSFDQLFQAAHAGLVGADAREKKWDRLTRALITLGVLIVFAGVIALPK